jgi:hypothetical protein
MANINFPRGLQPHRNLLRATEYTIPAAYTAAGSNGGLFIYDPVVATGGTTGREINISPVGTGEALTGCILAIYDENKVPLSHWVDGTAAGGFCLVADHPDQIFVAQGDGNAAFLVDNDAGANVNLAQQPGSTINFLSGWEIDESDAGDAGVAGDQLRLLRPEQITDNTVGIANADWLVQINNHTQSVGIVGVGV